MRYVYKLPLVAYNDESPVHEVIPLAESSIQTLRVFALKNDPPGPDPVASVEIACDEPIENANRFFNRDIYLQLLWLSTGLPTLPPAQLDDNSPIEFVENSDHGQFSRPDVSYGGLVNDKNTIGRFVKYTDCLNLMSTEDKHTVFNALNTFIWAKEIERLPDPHLKYTLYLTLYLCVFDQLAGNPPAKCEGTFVCDICGAQANKHTGGRNEALRQMFSEIMGIDSTHWLTKLVLEQTGSVRSAFLHHGMLSGNERQGGFFENWTNFNPDLELAVNVEIHARRALEQFMRVNSTKVV